MTIKAVLFDFDGVIANTLIYHVQAWQQVFWSYGVTVVPEDVYLLEGQLAEQIGRQLAQQKGLSLDEKTLTEMVRKKREIYNQITQAVIYPNTQKAIEFLKKNHVKIGLVTGAILKNIEPVTGREFLALFDTIVTGNEVANTKPHPEPYLTAAKKLAVESKNCLVIENAPLGIRAAKLAGMFCIALKTTIRDEKYLKEADLIVEDISQVHWEQWLPPAENGKPDFHR
ncbi:MAG: HAD family phosphatase [candidate division KSB1 bacterium]|nr:HAD family phosphatase [candidate division KSB1 bacterium]MDZ7335817.1 HAD family phosphatase [candidate division KSB1 bacterium]MDZ7356188.1 HAD family phosphatase [candidate division KSB1 bacterium]MDZ7400331.1 HAD family phosphatase [candidate division KSB1 bacterium]